MEIQHKTIQFRSLEIVQVFRSERLTKSNFGNRKLEQGKQTS